MGCVASHEGDSPSDSVDAHAIFDESAPYIKVGALIEVADARALRLTNHQHSNAQEGLSLNTSSSDVWLAPARPGYWWPARVLRCDRQHCKVRVHWEGYDSSWDEWVSVSATKTRPFTLSTTGCCTPPVGADVEVQLVQSAAFWVPGKVCDVKTSGAVEVALNVNRNSNYWAHGHFHKLSISEHALHRLRTATPIAVGIPVSSGVKLETQDQVANVVLGIGVPYE
eukprot:CAMPEP_0119316488 /NCGR_PEP_ID=MMETSP1333-20130426/39780_1 /TAXON_ID=418940 /ORGANISM="Scyphosphaera apsteinii, Strain RCC1455" /LENGTH=224 /DNA_ID=CAMNT_0007322145 /DNA_START=74 /DNA_END=748 /DNA_ORIENTATION=-